jgi:cation transporter-like permease
MELRQRKDKYDSENISNYVSYEALIELQNKNNELEILVVNLRKMLDLSRHREKRALKVLEESGIEYQHHSYELNDTFHDIEDGGQKILPSPTNRKNDKDNFGVSGVKGWFSFSSFSALLASSVFMRNLFDRSSWLIGLLIFQSLSSFILRYNESLLQKHPVIIFYLTMLVGAGGNAGNQATVKAIRGIALGILTEQSSLKFIFKEISTGFCLAIILGIFGFLRVTVIGSTGVREAFAITLALTTIVFSSVAIGATLPIVFQKVGIDPAHSSTTIQVIMDILGVVITCGVATRLLDQLTKPSVVYI